jgi:hypothetical protein
MKAYLIPFVDYGTSHLKTPEDVLAYISDNGCKNLSCTGVSPESETKLNRIACPFGYRNKRNESVCRLALHEDEHDGERIKKKADEMLELVFKCRYIEDLGND